MKMDRPDVALILVSALLAVANVAAIGGAFLCLLAGLAGPNLGGR